MLALVAFFPASGAFVGLTQSALMDTAPQQHQQRMAAWNLAGSLGAVTGPLLLATVLAEGAGWRSAYLLIAAAGLAALLVAAAAGPARRLAGDCSGPPAQRTEDHDGAAEESGGDDGRVPVREGLAALRHGTTARW